jgi:hypothetical protein
VTTLCPQQRFAAVCAQLFGGDETSQCSLIRVQATNVTCGCTLFGSSYGAGRRLADNSGSDGDEDSSAEFSTMLTSVATGFVQTWRSADDISASDVARNWDVLLTIASLFTFSSIAILLAYLSDDKEAKIAVVKSALKSSTIGGVHSVANDNLTEVDVLKTWASQSLPVVYNEDSFLPKYWRELQQFHRWLGVIFHYSPDFSRMVRVLSLTSVVLAMLFIHAITYVVAYTDDGVCESLHDQSACLQEKSSLSKDQSKCYWSSSDGTCHYLEPSNDLKRVLFVAVLSSMISAPLGFFMDWLIIDIISSSTIDTNPSSVMPENTDGKRGQESSVDESTSLHLLLQQYRNVLSKNERQQFDGRLSIFYAYDHIIFS